MSEFLSFVQLPSSLLFGGILLVTILLVVLNAHLRLERCTIATITTYVFSVLIISSYYLGLDKPCFIDIKWLVAAIDTLSSNMFVIFFIGFWVYTFSCHDLTCFSKEHTVAVLLTRSLMGSLAATAFPTAFLLILLSFCETEIFKSAVFSKVYFAFAGLSLTVISILIIYEEHKNIRKWLRPESSTSSENNQPPAKHDGNSPT